MIIDISDRERKVQVFQGFQSSLLFRGKLHYITEVYAKYLSLYLEIRPVLLSNPESSEGKLPFLQSFLYYCYDFTFLHHEKTLRLKGSTVKTGVYSSSWSTTVRRFRQELQIASHLISTVKRRAEGTDVHWLACACLSSPSFLVQKPLQSEGCWSQWLRSSHID